MPERADPAAREPVDLTAIGEGVGLVRGRVGRREFRALWAVHAEGRTRTDVGRALGLTRQWVTRLERRAMAKARA